MSDIWHEPPGATLLDPDEREGLIPTTIATRGELNDAEQANIARAAAWARRRRDIASERFALTLHKRMFDQVWRWAGKYRHSRKNIGIDWTEIPTAMRALFDDARYWIEHGSYPLDEISVRMHHRLTAIHAFPNGNGRHARLIADLLNLRLGNAAFTWGRATLGSGGEARKRYIGALQAADNHDIAPLLAFARS